MEYHEDYKAGDLIKKNLTQPDIPTLGVSMKWNLKTLTFRSETSELIAIHILILSSSSEHADEKTYKTDLPYSHLVKRVDSPFTIDEPI